jgi:protein-disulfide isomerase
MADDEVARLTMPVGKRDHAQGPADAPVTLVEYGDYECPHCGRAYPIVKEVQRRLGSKLRFVFRNFPLSESHPHAQHAAEAARRGRSRTLLGNARHLVRASTSARR